LAEVFATPTMFVSVEVRDVRGVERGRRTVTSAFP
jgi:hypothetical protein